jgi:hypothetical protein
MRASISNLVSGMAWLAAALAMGACQAVHTQELRSSGQENAREAKMAAMADSAPVVLDGAGAKAQEGKWVAVKGTARDARIAAAVVGEDLVVYCLGLERWPEGTSGRPVLIQGRIERTREFEARRGPGDEVAAGTDGPVWVLRNCRYAGL